MGTNLIPLGGTFLDALDLFSKVNDSQNCDLKIELHTAVRHREPPETEVECIVLLKHPANERPNGKLVRKLELGHQPVGIYESRSRAAYWDGRNALGEPVASGLYFYTLTAGDFTATRKMLIAK